MFVGNGLIMGTDYETGESADTSLTIQDVKSKVKFVSAMDFVIYMQETNGYSF